MKSCGIWVKLSVDIDIIYILNNKNAMTNILWSAEDIYFL